MKRLFPCGMVFAVLFCCSLVTTCWAAEQDDVCLDCHGPGATQTRRQVDLAPLKASIHGGRVSCVDCHPNARDASHQRNTSTTPVNCKGCHDQENHHGQTSGKSVTCVDCHGGHDVFPRSETSSRLHASRLARTCGGCHPHESGTGSLTASIMSFRVRGHSKADANRDYAPRDCLACHLPETAHKTVEQTPDSGCGRCHRPDPNRSRYLWTFHGPDGPSALLNPKHRGDLLYIAILAVSFVVFWGGWIKAIRIWTQGKPARRWDNPLKRLSLCLKSGLAQRSVFDRKIAGFSHYLIFLGVGVPFLIVVAVQARLALGLWPARLISLLLDVMGVGLLLGLCLGLFRRLRRRGEFPGQGIADVAVLGLLLCVVITGFATEGFRLAVEPTEESLWSPVGRLLAQALPASASAMTLAWQIHFLIGLAFVSVTPWTRLRHLIFAPLNIFFSNLGPPGRLESINVNSGDRFGICEATDLTWKDLLDSEACMACGRCRDACPAYAARKPLSPMKVIQDINAAAGAPSHPAHKGSGQGDGLHGRITPDETWACTTCYACQEACPVSVEHVGKLIGLRRSLVMDRSEIPKEGIRLLRNLEVFGDPTGFGRALRPRWRQSVPAKSFGNASEQGTLFWVGCQAAFNPRAQETARSLVTVANRAGIPVTILGANELCCGDPARRLGEEALFQELAQQNIKCFKDHGIKNVVTLCPHCFNTLAHEYPDFGGDVSVVHAVQWAARLLESGRLKITRPLEKKLAIHDPCYLGRVNKLSHFSRVLPDVVSGLELVEPVNNREQTFCCGAGGGHLWLHESGMRINKVRSEQCVQTAADLICTACPFCLTMLESGLKEVTSKPVVVRDFIEILEAVTG